MCAHGGGREEGIWKNNDVEMQCHARIYGFPDRMGKLQNVDLLILVNQKRRAIVLKKKKSELFKGRVLRSEKWF